LRQKDKGKQLDTRGTSFGCTFWATTGQLYILFFQSLGLVMFEVGQGKQSKTLMHEIPIDDETNVESYSKAIVAKRGDMFKPTMFESC
jgi:hypothetical protein